MARRQLLVAGGFLLSAALCPLVGRAAGPNASTPATGPNVTMVSTDLLPPTNLAFATDQATCDKARASLPNTSSPLDFCQILPHTAAGIFYWNWHGNGAHPVATGFRVYRTDGGRHDLVRQTQVKWEADSALFSGGLVNEACYAVTSYDATAESAATAPLCIRVPLPMVAPAPIARFAGPAPGPGGAGGMAVAGARLPAPGQLLGLHHPAGATDPMLTQCTAHGGAAGSAACRALLPRGGLAIAWSYGPAHIDGFRVYVVTRTAAQTLVGRPGAAAEFVANVPVAMQRARLEGGQVATLAVLDPRPAGFENECFAVTAFVGAEESEMSPPVCVGR